MAIDSPELLCAVVLFAASIGGWWMSASLPARARLYLRFAAMLFTAIAVSAPLGISNQTALFLLPMSGASLMVAALSRLAVALPVLVITILLVASLASGMGAMLWNVPLAALLVVILCGLTITAMALFRSVPIAALAGLALLGSGLALLEQGAGNGFLLFTAAALMGLAKADGFAKNQLLRSSNNAWRGLRTWP